VVSGTGIAASTWTHVALVRSGTELSVWINGSKDAYTTFSGSIHSGSGSLFLGRSGISGSEGYYTGAMDEVRVTAGAREPTGAATNTHTHDADGNLTDDGERTFEWDVWGRLTEVRRKADDALLVRYTYDALNRVMIRTVGNDTYTYVYDGWGEIAEYKNGDLQREYVYGGSIRTTGCA